MNAISVTTRGLFLGVAIGAALLSLPASSTQPATTVRIGVLTPVEETSSEAGLLDGLSELGYIEGRNLTIEWRRYAQSADALRSATADLVRSRVDLIVATGTQAARAALSATSTIPVVFVSGDPVAAGLVPSLARPGGNGTGVSSLTTDLMAKRLQLLQQIAPRTRRVILLVNPDNPMHAAVVEETERVARALRMHIVPLNARNADELGVALGGIQHSAGDAFIVGSDVFFIARKDQIGKAVRKARLPAIVPTKDYQGKGVLMSYGTSLNWMTHRAATYVDKILKGAKPADLPVEQSPKFELVIDLQVARELGLKVPQDLQLRADELIR
jgi:putative ABC transport system substrate-binding protein